MKIFFVCFIASIALASCGTSQDSTADCSNKVARTVSWFLADSSDSARLNSIVTVNDTTGLKEEFATLQIINAKIVLGHLTKKEIVALCHHKKVVYIETPKILFPNK